MKFKKISILACALVVTVSLTGCMGGRPKLPEGDFKIVTEQPQGVVEVLLQSADYGKEQSTIASVILPKDSKYEIVLTEEKYIDGKLNNTEEIFKYETDIINEKSPLYFIGNAGKLSEKNDTKTIYSLTQVDQEKTEDKDNPVYKYNKTFDEAINFDKKVQVESVGTDLSKDVPMIGYVKFKADDKEKKVIDLNDYKAQVGNYSEVTIVKIKAIKK